MKIVNDIISSFYSSDFYADVAHARRGIGMGFIFTLTVITIALITGYLVFYSKTLQGFASAVPPFAADLPAISVKDGKLSMDKPSPYKIPLGEEGKEQSWIIIDTDHKVTDAKTLTQYMESNNIAVLITQSEFITLKSNHETKDIEVRQLSELKREFSITHKDWMDFANYIAEKGVNTLIWVVAIGGFLVFLIYNLFATFVGALVMMIVGYIMRAGGLEFGALMRLTAAARIPFHAITAAPLMLGGVMLGGGLSWLVWFGYLVFAVTSSKRSV